MCMYSASSQLLPKAANETAGVASVSLYFSNAPTYMYVSTDKYICTFFEHTYAIGEYEERSEFPGHMPHNSLNKIFVVVVVFNVFLNCCCAFFNYTHN